MTSLGLGTYLGEPDAAADDGYVRAAAAFAEAGGTVFDTAANYRAGRSERVLGRAFAARPAAPRFVSTKAGYLPMGDGITAEPPRTWFQRVLEGPGILTPEEVVDGCHAMTPRYLSHQLEVSRAALGLATLDLFHLHNPEQQLPALGPEAFYATLTRAFEACEAFVAEGRIRAYGLATWNGFRVPPGKADHLSLERVVAAAEAAGGKAHHFRWIQLPLNLALPEAFLAPTQILGGARVTPLQAALALGLSVQTSASMMQARILHQLPADLVAALGGATPAQAALQFTRSCPGVTVALCGMGRPEHVAENAPVMGLPKVSPDLLAGLFR